MRLVVVMVALAAFALAETKHRKRNVCWSKYTKGCIKGSLNSVFNGKKVDNNEQCKSICQKTKGCKSIDYTVAQGQIYFWTWKEPKCYLNKYDRQDAEGKKRYSSPCFSDNGSKLGGWSRQKSYYYEMKTC